MPKGWPTISSRTRDTMMLGEVPIWVINPPSSDPKAIGIRNIEGDTPDFRAIWKAIGIMMASAPMFFTNALSTVTTVTSRINCARGVLIPGAKRRTAISMMPDRETAALTTRALPTMMTMSSENPEKAASGGTRPSASAASRAQTATTS